MPNPTESEAHTAAPFINVGSCFSRLVRVYICHYSCIRSLTRAIVIRGFYGHFMDAGSSPSRLVNAVCTES
mgnify:FL=1